MRTLIQTSFTAILVAAVAGAGLKTANINPHWPAMLMALAAALAACVLASVPLLLVHGRSTLANAQAALGATIIHLLALSIAGGIVILSKLVSDNAFVYWLATLYAATLIALVASIIQTVHAAAADAKT